MISEVDLINFKESMENLSGDELQDYSIDLINFIENSNLNIEDYRDLHFFSAFLGILDENNKLKKEYKKYEESKILTEDTEILNEATSNTKRAKITNLVIKVMKILDKTGLNVEKYKNLYENMSDEEFNAYMNNFLNDDNHNFYMELLPNKNEPSIYQIEEAMKALNIPENEYVYYRHDGAKDDPIRTRTKVPVGPIVVRRLQQILSKKNTYSLNIDSRDSRTGQVTADDKIARISDAELYGLTIFGADAAIKEFYSARADNMLAKRDMYSKISKYGYCYLEDLESDISQNQTINTINVYMLGGGIKSDIIESKEDIAKKELKRQIKNQAKQESTDISMIQENEEINKEFAYIPLTEEDLKHGRIHYEPTENYNARYANFTLEGLESFIADNRITKEMVAYTKVPMEELDVMAYDEETEGIIYALPVDIKFYESFPLDIRIIEDEDVYMERVLSQEERDNMDDSEYGIPSKKAYPLNDEEHVRKAIQLFGHADDSDKPGLARKIRSAAKKYGIKIDKDSLS